VKTKHQLHIDRYVARPLAWSLNFLVRLVGQILRLDHSLDKEFKRIAVCKFKGMGSIIQATPMLAALRNRFPEAEITFVTTKANKAILEKIDLVNHVITIDDSGIWKLLKSNITAIALLIKKRPDVYFDLEIYSHYSVVFTALTLSQNRIGFYLRSTSYRMGIYTHMMFYNPQVPISNVYMQMAQLLGCHRNALDLYRLSGELPQNFYNRKYIVINPNASDLRLERRWGKENFRNLIKKLLVKLPDHQIFLIGSGSERAYVSKVMKGLESNGRVENLAGETSLSELIGIIDHAEFMISNDTGPMHIAFSTGTPVLCLFGPCSPEQYGHFENAYIIYKRVYCSPCVHEFEEPPCKGNNVCMQLIQTEDVLAGIETLISNRTPKLATTSEIHYRDNDEILGKVNR
jgi:ADP-heptose:LPS heptosyltransferase